jgi:hypothetical protein
MAVVTVTTRANAECVKGSGYAVLPRLSQVKIAAHRFPRAPSEMNHYA